MKNIIADEMDASRWSSAWAVGARVSGVGRWCEQRTQYADEPSVGRERVTEIEKMCLFNTHEDDGFVMHLS